MLVARDIHAQRGSRKVLHGVSITLRPGTLTVILGPNGAGKSSLMRLLAGLARPEQGEVLLDGKPLHGLSAQQRAGLMAYLPQTRETAWNMSVHDIVALGRFHTQRLMAPPSDQDRTAIARALQTTDTAHLAARGVRTLSGGELARVLLARALAAEAPLLLADEPVAGLDPAHQVSVMAALRQRADEGAAIAIVMHDLTLAARHADHALLMKAGRIAAEGGPDTVLTAPILHEVFGITLARGAGFGPATPHNTSS